MSKVGIHKIGFKEQDKIIDIWNQQPDEQPDPERGAVEERFSGHLFLRPDQRTAYLTEQRTADGNGVVFNISLEFIVRVDADIDLARKYAGRPLVMFAWAVDGKLYTIGTKEYPVMMVISDRYEGLDTREVAVKASYQCVTRLLR